MTFLNYLSTPPSNLPMKMKTGINLGSSFNLHGVLVLISQISEQSPVIFVCLRFCVCVGGLKSIFQCCCTTMLLDLSFWSGPAQTINYRVHEPLSFPLGTFPVLYPRSSILRCSTLHTMGTAASTARHLRDKLRGMSHKTEPQKWSSILLHEQKNMEILPIWLLVFWLNK